MRELVSKGKSRYLLLVHLIFVVKYRKRLLITYGADVKLKMEEIANRNDFEIDTMEVVTYSPSISITQIVRVLKGETTYYLWNTYPSAGVFCRTSIKERARSLSESRPNFLVISLLLTQRGIQQ